MKPDDVFREYADTDIKVKMTEIGEDFPDVDGTIIEDWSLLIEGTAEELMFMSKLFAAISKSEIGERFEMSPFGERSEFFAKGSTKALCIERTRKMKRLESLR